MNIEAELLAIVRRELQLEPDAFNRETNLSELGDSLDWVNLLTAIEETFAVNIDFKQSEKLHTVDDLLQFLGETALA